MEELELQENYIERIIYYELYTNDNIFKFNIIFKKENMLFEYYIGDGFTDEIMEWGIDKQTQKIFMEFINMDCARCILLNIPAGLMFNTFDIYKIKERILNI